MSEQARDVEQIRHSLGRSAPPSAFEALTRMAERERLLREALEEAERQMRQAIEWLESYAEQYASPYLVTEAIGSLHWGCEALAATSQHGKQVSPVELQRAVKQINDRANLVLEQLQRVHDRETTFVEVDSEGGLYVQFRVFI